MGNANILTALETNAESNRVWDVASRVSQQHQSENQVINVVKPATTVYSGLDFAPLADYGAQWKRQQLDANAQFLQELTGLDTSHITVVEGYPADEISKATQAHQSDLLVMGVHNRRGLKRLLGSTTHAVLNHTQCDVLAVHPEGTSQAYNTVVIAVETGDLLESVLARASQFTQGATVKIVSVIAPLTQVFPAPEAAAGMSWSFAELTEEIKQQTQTKITEAAEAAGFNAQSLSLHIGEPRDEIIAAAKGCDADLIIMGSQNRGALNRMMLGSTARGVLNHTPCDVLICRG